MRIEVIRCDTCKRDHDAQYELPPEWIKTIQNTRYGLQEEQHFCCKECLIIWAKGQTLSEFGQSEQRGRHE